MSDLNKKVNNAIKVIKMADAAALERERERERESINELRESLVLHYSTGKDSDVVLHLCRMAGVGITSIYYATGLDPKGSIEHARDVGAAIVKPEKSFFQLMEHFSFPTRRARWCCVQLKEKWSSPVALQGIRTAESVSRAKRYKEPTTCKVYSKTERTEIFMPILDWTDEDVKEFVEIEKIKCHRHYYDEDGNFQVERRVGCLCCPMKSCKKLQTDFKEHPHMVKAYIFFGKRWWDACPMANSHKKFPNVYDLFFHNVFCKSYQDYLYKTTGMFGRLDTKSWMEDYFQINLP